MVCLPAFGQEGGGVFVVGKSVDGVTEVGERVEAVAAAGEGIIEKSVASLQLH